MGSWRIRTRLVALVAVATVGLVSLTVVAIGGVEPSDIATTNRVQTDATQRLVEHRKGLSS